MTKTIEMNTLYDNADENSYQFLAIAVIHQAMLDYAELKKVSQKSKRYEYAKVEIRRIKEFFRSEWFKMLNPTNMSGEEIINMLDEGCEI